ncbi:ATP-binding protein [Sphingomonas sp. Ant20]|uniref:ATP-binding protein n=1 Tax=Sphingomonas sp. Ant20 TaxID=104605 RepID=UPI000FE13E97|nr:ATP-binding protein [Sphingomonas sp. Ant20]
MKYAFDGKGGEIAVRVKTRADGGLRVTLSDDGKGLPAKPRTFQPGSGTGMKLIEGLARQVGSKATWSGSNGTMLELEFAGR